MEMNDSDKKALKSIVEAYILMKEGRCEYLIDLGVLVANGTMVGFRVSVNSHIAVALELCDCDNSSRELAFTLWKKYSFSSRGESLLEDSIYFDFSIDGITPRLLSKVKSLYSKRARMFEGFTLDHKKDGVLVSSMELDLERPIVELSNPRTKNFLVTQGLRSLGAYE